MVELPWRRASVRGIEVDIPRTLTKHSHVLPLPGGSSLPISFSLDTAGAIKPLQILGELPHAGNRSDSETNGGVAGDERCQSKNCRILAIFLGKSPTPRCPAKKIWDMFSPRGEGEHANASSRLGECRLRSHAPKLGG